MKGQWKTARQALLDAFSELALSRRYQDLGVGLIAQRASVARSTFYYHFKTKDELLLHNLRPMMSALGGLAGACEPTGDAEYWVAHIWEHRVRARQMFEGSTGRKIAQTLAVELQSCLRTVLDHPPGAARVTLLADQIAGSMTGLLRGWIAGPAAATPSRITGMLWSGARALVSADAAAPH